MCPPHRYTTENVRVLVKITATSVATTTDQRTKSRTPRTGCCCSPPPLLNEVLLSHKKYMLHQQIMFLQLHSTESQAHHLHAETLFGCRSFQVGRGVRCGSTRSVSLSVVSGRGILCGPLTLWAAGRLFAAFGYKRPPRHARTARVLKVGSRWHGCKDCCLEDDISWCVQN